MLARARLFPALSCSFLLFPASGISDRSIDRDEKRPSCFYLPRARSSTARVRSGSRSFLSRARAHGRVTHRRDGIVSPNTRETGVWLAHDSHDASVTLRSPVKLRRVSRDIFIINSATKAGVPPREDTCLSDADSEYFDNIRGHAPASPRKSKIECTCQVECDYRLPISTEIAWLIYGFTKLREPREQR